MFYRGHYSLVQCTFHVPRTKSKPEAPTVGNHVNFPSPANFPSRPLFWQEWIIIFAFQTLCFRARKTAYYCCQFYFLLGFAVSIYLYMVQNWVTAYVFLSHVTCAPIYRKYYWIIQHGKYTTRIVKPAPQPPNERAVIGGCMYLVTNGSELLVVAGVNINASGCYAKVTRVRDPRRPCHWGRIAQKKIATVSTQKKPSAKHFYANAFCKFYCLTVQKLSLLVKK